MESNLPTFKNFISEDDIAAAKQKRQEEWERVRRPDQPEEAPEEEYDPRSLFERLEANRIKKQEEFDEAHRLKNMVKGLENDEIEFLEKVSRQKEQEEQDKDMEERLLLAEYKSSLVHDRTTEQEEEIQTIVKKPALVSPTQKQPKSQKQLLAGMIRKKRVSDVEEPLTKMKKTEVKTEECSKSSTQPSAGTEVISSCASVKITSIPGLLPGIAGYSDSETED